MKKPAVSAVAALLAFCLSACGGDVTDQASADGVDTDLKVGVVLLHDEDTGYDFSHINGIRAAAENVGLPESRLLFKYNREQQGLDASVRD